MEAVSHASAAIVLQGGGLSIRHDTGGLKKMVWEERVALVKAVEEELTSFESMLVVNCGDGQFIRDIQSKFPDAKYVGTDVDINEARGRGLPNSSFFYREINALLFPRDTFDVIVIPEGFQESRAQNEISNEVFEILKNGGKVFVAGKHLMHLIKRQMTEEKVISMALRRSGFSVREKWVDQSLFVIVGEKNSHTDL